MANPTSAPVNPATQAQGVLNLSALKPEDQVKVLQAQIQKAQADTLLNIAYSQGLINAIQAEVAAAASAPATATTPAAPVAPTVTTPAS